MTNPLVERGRVFVSPSGHPILGSTACKEACCEEGGRVTCCHCAKGDTRDDGGCCYALGDRIRMTITQPAPHDRFESHNFMWPVSTGFSLLTDICEWTDPLVELGPSQCCSEIAFTAGPDLWMEYECVACMNELWPDYDGTFAGAFETPTPDDPKMTAFPGPGTVISEDMYCHTIHVFQPVEWSAEVDEIMDNGWPVCLFPVEWTYVCSGCFKPEPSLICNAPQDYEPESDKLCSYLDPPETIIYEDAKPAFGWYFTCHPDAEDSNCPWCTGICAEGTASECIPHTTEGNLTLVYDPDHPGDPDFAVEVCQIDPCQDAGCFGDALAPCPTQITYDLSGCDGGYVCCRRGDGVQIACDVEWDCYQDIEQLMTLERVDEKSCHWEEETATCESGDESAGAPSVGGCP